MCTDFRLTHVEELLSLKHIKTKYYIYLSIYIYLYIYINRERERERGVSYQINGDTMSI